MSPIEVLQQVLILLMLCFSDVEIEQFEDGSIKITACEVGKPCDDELSNHVYMPVVAN